MYCTITIRIYTYIYIYIKSIHIASRKYFQSHYLSKYMQILNPPNVISVIGTKTRVSNLIDYSPPVRWGLLDFMSVSSPPPPPPRPPPPLLSLCTSLSICCVHVMCRTSTTILWVQCGVPDLNREPVSSVWRAGPQPRAREFSVACRTPTASPWVQCGAPDPNRDPVSSVWRVGPQVMCQKICQKEWQKICQKESQKICQKKCQKDMSEDMSERMSKDMSKDKCQE